jgi:hypothetical protein
MIRYVFALAILGAVATPAPAQDAIPDLKGTWTGKGKSIVFGNNAHHAGKQSTSSPPRVRDIEAIHVVEGQDGRLAWGRSSSAVADTKEPFAWALRATTSRSSARIWTVISGSRSCRPTASRNVTRKTRHARAARLSRRAKSWIG